jgi:uncharacterized protein involved in response to NO
MQIQPVQLSKRSGNFALFDLGFRPFFLGAALFAVLSITVWITSYLTGFSLQIKSISVMQWHAHEMLYGYGLAVIAGFLLTAVKNWTGMQTLHGKPLIGLFALWASARLLMLTGTPFLLLAALLDLLFGLMLLMVVCSLIVKARQWKQLAVVSKLLLIIIGNTLFYLGAAGYFEQGVYLSIYGGVYLIIGLILIIGRRVIPFFIERGVAVPVKLKQSRLLDISVLVFFTVLFINELFFRVANITIFSAGLLFFVNGCRLINWHTPGLWKIPLLWSLYLSSWLINLGFLMLVLQYSMLYPGVLVIHLFAIGGIGLMTVAMMARVSLGHTGRNIREPSPLIAYALGLLVVSAIFRSIMPLIDVQLYVWWVGLSACCWIIAFLLFLKVYFVILISPRIDGQPG